MSENSSTTVSSWLAASQKILQAADIQTARLDCLVLLEDATGKDRAWLLSHPEHVLQIEQVYFLNTKITQRSSHVPLAYIRGKSEFYGRTFIVSPDTLVPRPETESMIELLQALAPQPGATILDVGTGSGCIAITAALEFPECIVHACDISPACLAIAQQNSNQLHADVEFLSSDLIASVRESDIVLANLPYVPDTFIINTAATHEPKLAIYGGEDGLDLYRTMFTQLHSWHAKPTWILTESLPMQHKALTVIARANGFELRQTSDFIQAFAPAAS